MEIGNFDSSSRRPADLYFSKFYDNNKSLAIDIGISVPTAPTHLPHSSSTKLYAANRLFQSKTYKYSHIPSSSLDFSPIIFESYGGYGPHTKKFLQRLIALFARRNNLEISVAANYIYGKIFATLFQSNALSIINHHPNIIGN